MSCARRLCQCRSDTSWTWRRFFELWEHQFTPPEEARLTNEAEKATGLRYQDIMVDRPPNT